MSAVIRTKEEVFDALPAPKNESFIAAIENANKFKSETIIVLDDVPTGTQTVSDVPVLTSWDVTKLKELT